MNSIEIAVVILTFIFGGALLGMSIGRKVPRHLTPETKAVVTAAMAVIGTMTALVISLLISTASTSFSARNEALSRMSADVVRLDQLLRRYGPETDGVRTLLGRYMAMKIDELFDHVGGSAPGTEEPASTAVLDEVQDRIRVLPPSDDDRHWLAAQALQIAGDLSNARWTMIQQNLELRSAAVPGSGGDVADRAVRQLRPVRAPEPDNGGVAVCLCACHLGGLQGGTRHGHAVRRPGPHHRLSAAPVERSAAASPGYD